jgi:CheY-like chemotaxis protein
VISFQAGQLSNVLIKLEKEKYTGTAALTMQSDSGASMVLAFWGGALTFAGDRLPSPLEFAEFLKQKLNIAFMDSALKVLESRVKNPDSVREMVEFINRFGLVKWDALQPIMEQDLLMKLEQTLTYAGTLQLQKDAKFDLSYGADSHGFAWETLQQKLVQRQQKWQALLPFTQETIPSRGKGAGELTEDLQTHLTTWVDGQRSLLSIATELAVDPLELATSYQQLWKKGWIKLPSDATASSAQSASIANRSVVLSVDDSPIVQVSIQRAISDRYEVLCAKSAVEALNLLNTRKVELLLLDVTMPDIDGLELCRTIRNIGKFRDLPVIMLTAKDGFMDKVKGQFAGSTHYLTKPVDREKLLPVLEKYIPVKEAVA